MRPSDFDQEELLLMLQDVLTSAASGRTENLRCPVCERGDLAVEEGDQGWIKLQCPQCGLQFEGLLGNSDDDYVAYAGRGKVQSPFG